MHPALIFYKFAKFISRKICHANWLVIMAMICPTTTTPAIAKMASRCDEPVFGAASIAIDKIAATAADQKLVDAAAKQPFAGFKRLLLSSADREFAAAIHMTHSPILCILLKKKTSKNAISRDWIFVLMPNGCVSPCNRLVCNGQNCKTHQFYYYPSGRPGYTSA